MGEATDPRLQTLRLALERLKADPEDQTRFFPRFVIVADELALDFDAIYSAAPQLVTAALIPPGALEPLQQLDTILTEMSEDALLWTDEALASRTEWQTVRRLAAEALEKMGT